MFPLPAEWPGMLVIFASPFYKASVGQFVEAAVNLPDVTLAVISQDPPDALPHWLRHRVAYQQVADSLSADHLTWAAERLASRFGRVHRILAVNEQIQVPVAEVRARLGVEGMSTEVIRDFRDKGRMKSRFREAGVPCARHRSATSAEEAWEFIEEVGFPVCVKPVDGAAAQATFRVDGGDDFREILRASGPSAERPLQIEEFVVGEEHSFETLSLGGEHRWHSLTHYHPTPLNVVSNPWIQWKIVLPREIDAPVYDDIRAAGRAALDALGMETGLTHLEWFRRADGSLAIGEVAARPPGAQIVTMMNRANDIDIFVIWSKLMIYGELTLPAERQYACGTAFLRGLGGGRVKDVHGIDEVLLDLGDMVTDVSIPQPGQAAGTTYEGEGFVLIRHPQTSVVEDALDYIINKVRVELI